MYTVYRFPKQRMQSSSHGSISGVFSIGERLLGVGFVERYPVLYIK